MLSENDDLRHPHDADRRWRESLYWNFLVPNASLGGAIYLRLDPNAGVSSFFVMLYRGFEATPAYFYAGEEGLRSGVELDDITVGGLHIRRIDPLQKFSLTFADGKGTDLQLTFSGIHPPFDYARSVEGCPSAAATNRFEQAGRAQGILRFAGQQLPISGFCQRDHSWGVRDWELIQHYKWFAVQSGETSAVHLAYFIIRGEVSYYGYVLDGAEVSGIVRADIRTTYGPDAIGHRHVHVSIVDERGKPTEVEGSIYALGTLPIERSLLFEGAGRFHVNGQPATGVAEYLWPASYVEHVKRSSLAAGR